MPAKVVFWCGSSRADLSALSESARRGLGFDLRRVQLGLMPRDWKPMPSVGPGVVEIRVRDATGAFRLFYLARFEDAIYVLHAFQKKSRKTPRLDLDVARTRYLNIRRTRTDHT